MVFAVFDSHAISNAFRKCREACIKSQMQVAVPIDSTDQQQDNVESPELEMESLPVVSALLSEKPEHCPVHDWLLGTGLERFAPILAANGLGEVHALCDEDLLKDDSLLKSIGMSSDEIFRLHGHIAVFGHRSAWL